MSEIKIVTKFKLFVYVVLISFLISSFSNLNAETIVYYEYNVLEDATYKITMVDGVKVKEVKVKKDQASN